jgi:hypothetical protein
MKATVLREDRDKLEDNCSNKITSETDNCLRKIDSLIGYGMTEVRNGPSGMTFGWSKMSRRLKRDWDGEKEQAMQTCEISTLDRRNDHCHISKIGRNPLCLKNSMKADGPVVDLGEL